MTDDLFLDALLAAHVGPRIRDVASWPAEQRAAAAESAVDVLAGGADALFAPDRPKRRGLPTAQEVRATLVDALAILALREDGVSFAGMTWAHDATMLGDWSLQADALSREARGAFFTPQTIAEDVTAGALGPLTHNATGYQLSQLQIADIACGSGAFLVAAARQLAASVAKAWDREDDPERDEFLGVYDTDDVRKAALAAVLDTSCLHGLDIDPLSVELARVTMQLLLPTQPALAVVRNIQVGDSLVGSAFPGWHDDAQYPPDATRFDWPDRRPFVFDLARPRTAGFDAVIGNVPFLGGKKINGALGKPYREYLVNVIAEGQRGSADLACYFALRAAELCNDIGVIGLISTNTLEQGETGRLLRSGLDRLGWIPYRREDFKWPAASASVHCVKLWCHYVRWIDPQYRSSVEDFSMIACWDGHSSEEYLVRLLQRQAARDADLASKLS